MSVTNQRFSLGSPQRHGFRHDTTYISSTLSSIDTSPLNGLQEVAAFRSLYHHRDRFFRLLVKNEYAAQLVIDSLEKAVQGETTFRSTVAIPYGHSLDNYKSLVKANIATADKLLELNRKDFRALISKSAYQKAVTDGLVSDSSQYHRQLLGEINRRRTSISRLLTEIPIRYTLLRDIFKQAKTVLSQYDTAVAGRDRSSIIRCALTTGQSHSSLTQYVNRVESANLMVDKYRDLLTNRNLKLLAKIALVLETSQHSADSNFSHGFLGLIKAVDGFDLTRGFRFTSYASRAILNAIIRGNQLDRFIIQPAEVHRLRRMVAQVLIDSANESGGRLSREESDALIAQLFPKSKLTTLGLPSLGYAVTINSPQRGEARESSTWGSIEIDDPTSDFELLENSEQTACEKRYLASVIDQVNLSPLERRVLDLQLTIRPEQFSAKDVATMLRLTPKNVLAREEAALSYLKVERPTDGSRIICKVLSKRIMALSADRIDRAALDSTTRRVMEILYCFAVGDLGLKDSEIARYLRYTPRNIRLRREAAIRKITKAIELKRSRDLL